MNSAIEFLVEHETAAKTIVSAVYGFCACVTFMVIMRLGWWKRTKPETDWATTKGCPRCSEYRSYPDRPELAMHQAGHEIAAILLQPLVRLIDRVSRT